MEGINMEPLIYEGIYLLQEERFIETNRNIYKIGRSKNIYTRVSSYENGSIVYLMIACNNTEIVESELIRIFNKDFDGIKYYGSEYFMGDLETMKDTIIDYIKSVSIDIGIIKLIDIEIRLETVDKDTDIAIPKYEQELYSKAKLTTLTLNNNIWEEHIDNIDNNEDNEFEDCIEDSATQQPLIDNAHTGNNYTINNNGNGNIIINNSKNDRICPCGKVFALPYLLKRHQNSKFGCFPYMLWLKQHTGQQNIDYEEKEKKAKEFFCKYCNRKLANKFSMERHYNVCKDNEDNNNIKDMVNNTSKLITLIGNVVSSLNNDKFDYDIKLGDLTIKCKHKNIDE